ncbi:MULTISPECIES: hypothetical protein [Morganellaceae]|uniref:hypothetical protein n=1 Tax=Morganella morganii TaxID=582 RepID=UPI001D14A929|nr:hypothetical protein [Morganella morganii]
MTYFAKPGSPAVMPVTFPLVFVFSAGKADCTGSHFCLTVAGHQVFDDEQQQLIAGMSPATIQLAWQVAAGGAAGAVLSVGRHRVALCDNDITVYRFAPGIRRTRRTVTGIVCCTRCLKERRRIKPAGNACLFHYLN